MKKFIKKLFKRILIILGLATAAVIIFEINSKEKKDSKPKLIEDPTLCSCKDGCDKCVFL